MEIYSLLEYSPTRLSRLASLLLMNILHIWIKGVLEGHLSRLLILLFKCRNAVVGGCKQVHHRVFN